MLAGLSCPFHLYKKAGNQWHSRCCFAAILLTRPLLGTRVQHAHNDLLHAAPPNALKLTWLPVHGAGSGKSALVGELAALADRERLRSAVACSATQCSEVGLAAVHGAGSGKSALVGELAALTGNAAGCIRVHVDDQMDAKSLLGAYICTSVPGEFAWQPGPLTQVPSVLVCHVGFHLAVAGDWRHMNGAGAPPLLHLGGHCCRPDPQTSRLALVQHYWLVVWSWANGSGQNLWHTGDQCCAPVLAGVAC